MKLFFKQQKLLKHLSCILIVFVYLQFIGQKLVLIVPNFLDQH